MYKSLIAFFIVLLYTSTVAQPYNKLDSLCQELSHKYNLPGIALIGVKEGRIVHEYYEGKANLNKDFSDSKMIYIASNTKAFTALAMAQLNDQKTISYNDKITQYIPRKNFPSTIEVDHITIRDLLQHTHGLSNDPLVFRTAYSGEYPSDLRKLLRFTVYSRDSISAEFKYGNLGYILCGLIIEEVTGHNWRKYIDGFMRDISLTSATCQLEFDDTQELMPFDFIDEQPLSSKKSFTTLHSSGGIYSTLSDMGKFLMLFTDPDQTRIDTSLINRLLRDRCPVDRNIGPFAMKEYGNGWIYGSLMGKTLYFHFGSFPGYESIISFHPDTKTGLFVFINEKTGGQRIAAMLTAYYYLLQTSETDAEEKVAIFYKFIDPLYTAEKKFRKPYNCTDPSAFTGTYTSEAYGQLMVDKTTDDYYFNLGKLSGKVYEGTGENHMIVEWTPGIEENFSFDKNDEVTQLIYGDYGVFVKI